MGGSNLLNATQRLLIAAATVGAVTALAGCSEPTVHGTPVSPDTTTSTSRVAARVFDDGALEKGVRSALERGYDLTGIDQVRCPADQEVRKGRQFDCAVLISGENRTVTVTVRDESGEYEVSVPR
jgi:uncharacterized protein DUF4333